MILQNTIGQTGRLGVGIFYSELTRNHVSFSHSKHTVFSWHLRLCLLILGWKKINYNHYRQHNPYYNPYHYYLLSEHLCKYYHASGFRISYKEILCNHPSENHGFNFPCAKAFKSMKLKQGQIIFVSKWNKVNKFQLLIVPNNHRIKYLTWHKVLLNQWIKLYKASYYCNIRTT